MRNGPISSAAAIAAKVSLSDNTSPATATAAPPSDATNAAARASSRSNTSTGRFPETRRAARDQRDVACEIHMVLPSRRETTLTPSTTAVEGTGA